MSFPAGMAVGLALGIAVGTASGRKSVLEAIAAYARTHGIILQDASGAPLSWENFLSEAVQTDDGRKRPLLIALLALGVLVLVGLVAYFWWQGG